MTESPHPSGEHLAAYALGRVTARESVEIESHLVNCTLCTKQLETVPDDGVVTLVKQTLAATPTDRIVTRSEYGEFRIIAQGGLGFIALARDQAFGRYVAVKRILPEGADDQYRRKRFLREAAITGRLEHPGIAPVYGIGEDESGRPCYAMRYVPGETLLDSIKLLHANGSVAAAKYRPLLSRFISLCNTAAYAHSRGVIHRDIKPANVAIGEYGETILLDWGLAQADEVDVEQPQYSSSEPRSPYDHFHTKTGTVLGTPGYMAPEQAKGERVGPTADVYSLGATLLTLLTGCHPDETARKGKPPAALLAIAARAMSRQPAERYPFANELARDIEHWLNDEPVAAYHEPFAVRFRRFLRRHSTAATVAVALLLMTTVGLAIGTVLLNREQEKTNQALSEKTKAVISEAAERKKAEEAETQTMEDFRAATDDAIEKLIGNKPKLGPNERAYIENTLKRWQNLAARLGDDEKSLTIRGEGHFRVATLWNKLGRLEEANAEYVAAVKVFEQVVNTYPKVSLNWTSLAKAHSGLGTTLRDLGKREEAASEYRTALKLMQSFVDRHPDDQNVRRDWAATLLNLSNLHVSLGQQDEAQKTCEQACNLLLETMKAEPDNTKSWELLAGAHNNYGGALITVGQYDRALQEVEAARKLRAQLVAKYPESLDYRQELAQTYITQGVLLRNMNQREQACRELRSARDLLIALVADYPSFPTLSDNLAICRMNLGAILLEVKRIEEAISELCASRDVLKKLSDQSPNILDYRRRLADAHNNLGMVYKSTRKQDLARKEFLQTIDILTEIRRTHPQDVPSQVTLGGVQCGLGQLAIVEKQYAESLPWFDKALATLNPIMERTPNNTKVRLSLRNTHEGRALSFDSMKRFDESMAEWELAIILSSKNQLDSTRMMQARTWFRAGRHDEAFQELEHLTHSESRDATFWYDLACFFAATSAKVNEERDKFEQQAIALLRKSIKLGYHDINKIESNVDFDSIRSREQFRQLTSELKATTTSPVK